MMARYAGRCTPACTPPHLRSVANFEVEPLSSFELLLVLPTDDDLNFGRAMRVRLTLIVILGALAAVARAQELLPRGRRDKLSLSRRTPTLTF